MKSISILPFEINVEMRTYQNQAFPLGIAKANIQDYDMWLCGKLILNFYNANKPSLIFDIYDEDLWSEHEGFITTETVTATKLCTILNSHELIKLNKTKIDQGCYISGGFDSFYIPHKGPFKKYHYDHDYVLYGYNDVLSVFYSAGYLDDGRYDYFTIAYDDYLRGVINHRSSDMYVNYHRINNAYRPTINVSLIQRKLQDYVCSGRSLEPDNNETIYGIEAWRMLAQYVSTNQHFLLDVRYGRLFMEHHYIMLKRLRALAKQGNLADDDLIDYYCRRIFMRANVVFSLFLKYNYTLDPEILPRINNLIYDITQCETEIINKIILCIIDK